jgi:hypothetical protein
MATKTNRNLRLPRTFRGVKRNGTPNRYTYQFPGGVIIVELFRQPLMMTFCVYSHDSVFIDPEWFVLPVDPVTRQDKIVPALNACFRAICDHWDGQLKEANEKLQQLSRHL